MREDFYPEWDNEPDYEYGYDDFDLDPIVCEECGEEFWDWPDFNWHYCE